MTDRMRFAGAYSIGRAYIGAVISEACASEAVYPLVSSVQVDT